VIGLPKVRLETVACFERDVALRLPFRFGATTLRRSTQAVIRVVLALEDGGSATGVAAETLAAKWFDKSPAFSDEQNLQQLRQAVYLAIDHYRDRPFSAPFALFASSYQDQLASGAELGLVPLVASFGPALLDRAILDALGRRREQSFAHMLASNVAGIAAPSELVADLAGFDLAQFLARLRPRPAIAVRHTVGLADPLVAADQDAGNRVGDGLPETLAEVVRHYAPRYYKLKVGGAVDADLERLTRIAAVLDREAGDYRVTLDGNEQYHCPEAVNELWCRMRERPALARLVAATLFIEQPINRARALATSVADLARQVPLIIDESDGELASFPAALALGYRGVSSKSCKGLYKSILNAARIAKLNAQAGRIKYFMSAEDLTTLAGTSVQQDLALAALLGLAHVERNGHHFVDGMSFAPEGEQAAFACAHPDLYSRSGGPARLVIDHGRLRLGSLDCPGFAVAAAMDFAAMRRMPPAPCGRIAPAHPERSPEHAS
jgi:L-alanine-DL-glutamate epimerase-like enolase superfamily enzyme